MFHRLLLAAGCVAIIQLGVLFIERQYVPAGVTEVELARAEIPRELDGWKSEDVALDPRLYRVVGAVSQVNRKYRDAAQYEILLHSAVLNDVTDGVEHYPEVCYPGSGWKIAESKDLALDRASTVTARVLVVERDAVRAVVLYWYQMDGHSFVDRDSYRQVRRNFWGAAHWPPAVKVLLQSAAVPDVRAAEDRLRGFAERLARRLGPPQENTAEQ